MRSTDAADAAAAVAEHFDAEIAVLHVLAPRFDLPLSTSAQTNVPHGGARAEAEEKIGEFRSKEWDRLRVKRVLLEGDPARTIVEYATEEHVDLIMMPTHGYGPFDACSSVRSRQRSFTMQIVLSGRPLIGRMRRLRYRRQSPAVSPAL